MAGYKTEIDGNELFKRIAGHSYYKGDDILARISLMQEGKLPKKDIKPANVVEVVRCKDCRYFTGQSCRINEGMRDLTVGGNGFCFYGDRRKEGGGEDD